MKYIKYTVFLFSFCVANNYVINASHYEQSAWDTPLSMAIILTGADLIAGSDGSTTRALLSTAALAIAKEVDGGQARWYTTGVSLLIIKNLLTPIRKQTDLKKV